MSAIATPSRRTSFRSLILIALWAAFLIWMALGTSTYSIALMGGYADQFPPNSTYPAVLFALDFWGLTGTMALGLIATNAFDWHNGKRLIFGSMTFAVALGRLAAVSITGFALSLPLSGPVIFLAAPFVLLFGGVGVIFTVFVILGALFTFFVGVPVVLFNQILAFDNALHVYRFQARGLAGYIVRAAFWLRNERMPDAPPDDSRGARFATPAEVRQLRRQEPEAMVFGHAERQPLFLKTDKHVLIMASTRSGKGVTLIMPHLLRYQGSAFVLDPKGENAKGTGRRRAALNQAVHYLDPFGISGKPQSRFNPLARFTPTNMEAESKALAAALFVVGERERDHWTASGQQLLAAIILYVYCSPDVPQASKDLPAVRRILLGGVSDVLKAMVEIDDADGLLRDLAMSFIATPEKEFGSIVSTAQRQTEILDNPFMIACLSATGDSPEVDFKAWHGGTMTVYLCLSAPKFPTFNRWLRLVLTSALDEMTDTLNPPKLPVCFMLDELATLGHLPAVENAVGLAAGYGIQLVTVFQDVAQMRDLYKGRWASFIGNAGIRALFNLDDFDTADYWSKFIGGRLIETRSRQEDLYGLSGGQNVGETMRPLIAPDQMMMDFASRPANASEPSKMLVLAQGAHPIVTDRVAYWQDASLYGTWDDPRAPAKAQRTPPYPMPPPSPPQPPTSPPPVPPRPNGPAPQTPGPDLAPSTVEAPIAKAPDNGPRHLASIPVIVQNEPEPPMAPDVKGGRGPFRRYAALYKSGYEKGRRDFARKANTPPDDNEP